MQQDALAQLIERHQLYIVVNYDICVRRQLSQLNPIVIEDNLQNIVFR